VPSAYAPPAAAGGVAVEHVGVMTEPISVIGGPHATPFPLQPGPGDELEQAASAMAATSAQALPISSLKTAIAMLTRYADLIDGVGTS
jgi:hypothetical protein